MKWKRRLVAVPSVGPTTVPTARGTLILHGCGCRERQRAVGREAVLVCEAHQGSGVPRW